MYDKLFGFNSTQKQTLKKLLFSDVGTNALPVVQNVTPSDGDTITVNRSARHTTVVLWGEGILENVHIDFPPDNISQVGQIIRVASTIQVEGLTMNGSDIMNKPETLQPNDCFGFQKIEEDMWIRII